jgi:hypothetical protein
MPVVRPPVYRVTQFQNQLRHTAKARLHDDASYPVGVGVGGGTAILEVAVAVGGSLTGNADTAAAVGDAVGKLVDGASLVAASETTLVALTVHGNVLEVAALKLLESSLNVRHTALVTHSLGREVAVEAGTVPLARDGLGIDRDLDTKVLGDAVEKETREPKVVTHCNVLAMRVKTWWGCDATYSRYQGKGRPGTRPERT